MQTILSSSPRLVTFSTLESDTCNVRETTRITAKDFINLDMSSSLTLVSVDTFTLESSTLSQIPLKPWQCESTLKVFRAKITDISRPDVGPLYHMCHLPASTPKEVYPGQCHDLQRRIYECLARLAKLEQLELGNDDSFLSSASMNIVSTNTKHDSDFNHGESGGFHEYQILSGYESCEWVRGIGGVEEVESGEVHAEVDGYSCGGGAVDGERVVAVGGCRRVEYGDPSIVSVSSLIL